MIPTNKPMINRFYQGFTFLNVWKILGFKETSPSYRFSTYF